MALFLKTYYKSEYIGCSLGDSIYYQIIPKSFLPKDIKSSENILAYITGLEIPDGANDDGSGTVAIMEIGKLSYKRKRRVMVLKEVFCFFT